MKRIAIFIGMLIWWIISAGASQAEEQRILLLPISIQSNYQPLTEAELNTEIKKELVKAGLTPVSVPELKEAPTDETAARDLAQRYNADFVGWGSIEFSHEFKSIPSGPLGSAGADGSPYRFQTTSRVLSQVRMTSKCTITLIPADNKKGPLLSASQLPHAHSVTTSTTPGSAGYRKVEHRLSGWCVKTLVSHLQETIEQSY